VCSLRAYARAGSHDPALPQDRQIEEDGRRGCSARRDDGFVPAVSGFIRRAQEPTTRADGLTAHFAVWGQALHSRQLVRCGDETSPTYDRDAACVFGVRVGGATFGDCVYASGRAVVSHKSLLQGVRHYRRPTPVNISVRVFSGFTQTVQKGGAEWKGRKLSFRTGVRCAKRTATSISRVREEARYAESYWRAGSATGINSSC